MQTIEKSISICDNKKYDYISASDQGFKNCMDMTAFAYETCSGDSSIYKSVCNNAIIEGILKTANPSVQDLNDRAYEEAEVVLGSSTGNFATTTAATTTNTTTTHQSASVQQSWNNTSTPIDIGWLVLIIISDISIT